MFRKKNIIFVIHKLWNMTKQIEFSLPEFRKGFHLITSLIEKKLPELPENGLLNIFIKHTSAAIAINENADPSVRYDMKQFVEKMVPDNLSYFTHTLEGADDMPAHIKSSLFGQSITIPITNRRLNMGIWQGVYLCEFRDYGDSRQIILTIVS
jgi:secondary thiamine-phosphate synthase enzyme